MAVMLSERVDSNNIGQITYLQSEQDHIYFGGAFIRAPSDHEHAIRFRSKGEKQAYFLRHEGYLGAVGAFLPRQPKNWGRRNSLESAAPGLQGNQREQSFSKVLCFILIVAFGNRRLTFST
jgi:type II pantothenate kinase